MKFKDETRGGFPVRIYATDAGGQYPIHGAYLDRDDIWVTNCWAAGGQNNLVRQGPTPYDLLPLREPSEAAVEEAWNAWPGGREEFHLALRAAYEIDFPEGGK